MRQWLGSRRLFVLSAMLAGRSPAVPAIVGAIGFAGLTVNAGAVEYIPMYQLNLMGGQYFFAGQKSSLNGNAVGNVSPAVKFNDRWTLLPTYQVDYQGTKPVTDPVGSGTLFQQRMDHRVSAAGLYSAPGGRWRFKQAASYKIEFMKETRDEAWGKGLFDYHKAGIGFEVEDVYKEPFSVRLGYDFFYIRFPQFKSLESQAGVDPNGNPLGRETAGSRVLDTMNNQFSLVATRPFPYNDPKVALQANFSVNFQRFQDQRLVDIRGQYQSSVRQDVVQNVGFSLLRPQAITLFGDPYRLSTRLGIGAAYTGSNQNTFDAGRTQFIPDAYSYASFSAGPSWGLSWGSDKQPSWVSLGFNYTRIRYLGRLIQDPNGAYLNSKQVSDRYHLSLGYGYPIAPNFNLRASANFLWSDSNQRYEATYKYTYNTANYLLGFAYDY